jgi:hypothetical protein
LVGGFVIATEDVVKKIIQYMVGIHLKPEQAERLKRFIDAAATETNLSAACPCSKCQTTPAEP